MEAAARRYPRVRVLGSLERAERGLLPVPGRELGRHPSSVTRYRDMVNRAATRLHALDSRASSSRRAGRRRSVAAAARASTTIPPLTFMRQLLSQPIQFRRLVEQPLYGRGPDSLGLSRQRCVDRRPSRCTPRPPCRDREPPDHLDADGWRSGSPSSPGTRTHRIHVASPRLFTHAGCLKRPIACGGRVSVCSCGRNSRTIRSCARDPVPGRSVQLGWQRTVGAPKAAMRAFRFPFVALKRRGGAYVWGRTPWGKAGRVRIQKKTSRGWTTVKVVRTNGNGIFRGRFFFSTSSTGRIRARRVGSSLSSVSFSLKPTKSFADHPAARVLGLRTLTHSATPHESRCIRRRNRTGRRRHRLGRSSRDRPVLRGDPDGERRSRWGWRQRFWRRGSAWADAQSARELGFTRGRQRAPGSGDLVASRGSERHVQEAGPGQQRDLGPAARRPPIRSVVR